MLDVRKLLILITILCAAVQEEASSLETRFAFGATLDLDLLGIEVGEETLIPGLAVASSRAKPLAGIMLLQCSYMRFCSCVPFFETNVHKFQN